MRSKMVLASVTFVGLSFGLGILQVKAGDDLVLPPELRETSQSNPALSPPPKPQKVPPSKTNAKTDGKTNAKPDTTGKEPASAEKSEPGAAAAKVEKPKKTNDEDPLSFGMKWNADPTNGGPGSLSEELNKNINGATVGTGAEVGFKYKF